MTEDRKEVKEEGERQKERGVTHWVSSRGEGDGLHVMIGDYLWRERRDGA